MYSTYIGGTVDGQGTAAAVDAQGNAYVTGLTTSSGFPTTVQALEFGGRSDAFLTKLNPTGSELLYSTFLGGSNFDQGNAVAVDSSGNAYVAGATDSSSAFPTTPGAFQSTQPPGNTSAAFVTKFATSTGETSQTITFGFLPNEVYGTGPLTLTATTSSGLPVSFVVTGPVALKGSELTILGAGPVTVSAFQQGDTTYAPATTITRSFMVNKAVLQATAKNVTRSQGLANPMFTYSLSGFVNGDTSVAVSGAVTETSSATVSSGAGAYPIIFVTKGLTAANYSFVYVPGTLTVTTQICQSIANYVNGFSTVDLSLNHGGNS